MSGQTPDPRGWTGALADAAWGLFGAAAVLAFLAVWVVVPPPLPALLAFGVVAPELSPALSLVALAVAGGAWMLRVRRPARPAAVLAVAAATVFALPLLQLPAAARRFDAAMTAAGFGDALAHTRGDKRSARFRLRDLLLGVGGGESTVRRGVEMGTAGTGALAADVYARDGVRAAPLLVQIYGGAWQRGQRSDDEAFARYFAARGYVVAAIDYRHAPAARWPAQIDDVRAAIAWLRAHAAEFGADPARLVLIGRSAGAQLALVAAYQDRAPAVAGVVSLYGPVFLADGWREPPRPDPLDVRAVLETYLGGTPDQVPDRYTAASPVTYVSPQAPPTLLVYGRRDHIVDIRFAQRLEATLREAGVPVALLDIPWAEHAFDLLPDGLSAQLALYYTERFVAQVTAAAPAAESVH
jgi:acetyl esterase/lipase